MRNEANATVELSLHCKRCGARLVPIVAPWAPGRSQGTRAFLCPRFGSCGVEERWVRVV